MESVPKDKKVEKLRIEADFPNVVEISEDPMKKLEGESAKIFIELLEKKSERNQIRLLKKARFESNSVKFTLNINKK